MAEVRRGVDPSAKRDAARKALTVKELFDRFITDYSEDRNKPSTVKSNRGYGKRYIIPIMGQLKVPDVTRADISHLMKKMSKCPTNANRVLAAVRKMFNMAEVRGLRPDGSNPCRHIPKFPERGKTRLIFNFDGPNLNKGFINLRAAEHPEEKRLHSIIEGMWKRYEPYADPDFRDGFARDVDARFWEMYLGWTFLEAGHALLPASDRLHEGWQPDLCVLTDNGRIWIEAIAPDEGAPGPDQISRPVPMNEGGGLFAAPVLPSSIADDQRVLD